MAGAGVKINVQGVEALKRAFGELEPKLARKVIKAAELKALTPVKAAVVAAAPELSGKLKRSVRIRTAKGPRGGGRKVIAMALLVGGSGAKVTRGGKTVPRAWWAFLQEWGWRIGKRIRHGGKVVGRVGSGRKVAGKFFVRSAMRAHESQVQATMAAEILAGVEREAGR